MAAKEYKKYEVKYIDKWTNGKVNTTQMWGYYTVDDVIEFMGLNDPEVSWYEVNEIDKTVFED